MNSSYIANLDLLIKEIFAPVSSLLDVLNSNCDSKQRQTHTKSKWSEKI